MVTKSQNPSKIENFKNSFKKKQKTIFLLHVINKTIYIQSKKKKTIYI